jgi:3-hydroxyacyl-[acyl-carrier-protein] dehydratase
MPPPLLYDLSKLDFSRPLYDIDAIRRINPQRNQMEHLTAIVYMDTEGHGLVGYKDVGEDEFWVAGHMPGYPLMPGVIMCEAAAQLASFYSQKTKLVGGDFVGFGGMDEVRFRLPVYPKTRLVLAAKLKQLRPNRMAIFDFQGIVNSDIVFTGQMMGVPVFHDKSRL